MASTTSKRKGCWLKVAGLVVVLVVVEWIAKPISCFCLGMFLGTPQTSFDSAAWKRSWSWRCWPRQQMAGDLVASQLLIGKTPQQVSELLGPADPEPYLLQEQPRWTGSMIYKLGPNFADYDWLVVGLDKGLVTDAQVVSD